MSLILVLNPGSTSTKIAVYRDGKLIFSAANATKKKAIKLRW